MRHGGGRARPWLTHPRRRLALLGVLAAVVVPVAGLLIALPLIVDLPPVRGWIMSAMSRRLERPIEFDRLSLRYEPLPTLRMTRLRVANAGGFGPDPLLFVEEAGLRVALRPLVLGSLRLGEITLERPRVVLEQRRDGRWNLPPPSVMRSMAAPLALVSRVRLREGHVQFQVAGEADQSRVHRVGAVALSLDDIGRSRPIRIRMSAELPDGGAGVELDGEVGPVALAGGDLGAVPARLSARLRAEETRSPAESAFGVTSAGGGELRLEGRLGQLTGDGQLTFTRLTLVHRPATCPSRTPRTLTLESVELPIRVAGPVVTLRPFAFRVAEGLVQGEGVVAWRTGRAEVQLADVRIQGVTAERLLVDFLCHPYAVAGRLDGSATLAFAGTKADLWRSVRGQWQLQVGPGRLAGPAALALASRVARVGLMPHAWVGWDLPTFVSPAPVDFQRLTATGTVEGGEVRAREILWMSREARVGGTGRYGLLDTYLDFQFGVEVGRRIFNVRIGGTAREPSFSPVPRSSPGSPAQTRSSWSATLSPGGSTGERWSSVARRCPRACSSCVECARLN